LTPTALAVSNNSGELATPASCLRSGTRMKQKDANQPTPPVTSARILPVQNYWPNSSPIRQEFPMEVIQGGKSAGAVHDPLLTPEQVAERLNVSPDWVRDHS
jgi:hypothetical protein